MSEVWKVASKKKYNCDNSALNKWGRRLIRLPFTRWPMLMIRSVPKRLKRSWCRRADLPRKRSSISARSKNSLPIMSSISNRTFLKIVSNWSESGKGNSRMQALIGVALSARGTQVPTHARASSRRSLIACTKMQSVATNDKLISIQHVLMQSVPSSQNSKARAANDQLIQSGAAKAVPTYSNGSVRGVDRGVNAAKCYLRTRKRLLMTCMTPKLGKNYLNQRQAEHQRIDLPWKPQKLQANIFIINQELSKTGISSVRLLTKSLI